MGRVKKSTRKFEQKHLKRTLDDRKDKAKLKQQFQLREKKKKKRATQGDDSDGSGSDAEASKPLKKKDDGPKIFENMSVEQFFQGGFEVPEPSSAGKKKKKSTSEKKSKAEPEPENTDEGASESGEDEDEFEKHKDQLAALAEQDPEFYKYMKENDPELLDFTMAEKDNLSEVDDLSEAEDEQAGKKKGKKEEREDSTELTMADVKKWRKAMTEEKSLRALRQVVLAFRAAAHANDVEEDASMGGFKYSITNPNGMHPVFFLFSCFYPLVEMMKHKLAPVLETCTLFHADMANVQCPWRGAVV